MIDRLVGGKARPVGGDFEEDAAGLAEINGMKILAIDHRRDAKAERVQFFAELHLLLFVFRAEGDVMDGTGGDVPEPDIRSLEQVDLRRAARSEGKAAPSFLFAGKGEAE